MASEHRFDDQVVVLKDGPFGPAVRYEVDDAVFALTIEVDWLE